MYNLIKVSSKRMFKDRIFIVAAAILLCLSLYTVFENAPELALWAENGDDVALEDCFFNIVQILGLFIASFISIFIGTENSDGTLRNKLIAGHGRTSVFMSFFAVTAIGSIILTLVWLSGSMTGMFYFDGFSYGWETFAQYFAVLLCCGLLYAAVFTALSLLIPNKAVAAVVSLVLWFVLLYTGAMVVNKLAEPEMFSGYSYYNGEILVESEPQVNPYYVSGTLRKVLEAIAYINPVCPAMQLDGGGLEKPVVNIMCSLLSTAAVLTGGCLAFRKKDMK